MPQRLEQSDCTWRPMKNTELLEKLEEVVNRLRIELRWDEGEFAGGICRLRDRRIFLINRSLPNFEKISVLCRGLAQLDISSIFIPPAIRARIESYK